jgi:uncharacterized protein
MKLLACWSNLRVVVIGMLHLPALPGAPGYGGDIKSVRAGVLRDAETLVAGGVHGLMVENFGDVPFYPGRVPAEVVAQMTALACEVRRSFAIPLGINVLRNDGLSALAVAAAVGAEFVRINVLCGARLTDQGIIEGAAHDVLRLRRSLGADIKILADVDVKHSAPLAPRRVEDEVDDTLERGLADGLVVSGAGTGKATEAEKVRRVKAASGAAPVFIGSGVTPETAAMYAGLADGLIVGTALKVGGRASAPVEALRVAALMAAVR